jgi:glycosyltransferase involved in cell wall biosynthesis
MHILWLASWYPNKTDPFDGDFIQRHAAAVSGRCRVTVIHVAKDAEGKAHWETETRVSRLSGNDGSSNAGLNGALMETVGLTEKISYFRPWRTPFSFVNRLVSRVRTVRLYARAIDRHIAAYGRPSLIHVHVCMNAGILALWAKRRWKVPYIITEHFTGYIPGSKDNYFSRSFLYRYVNKRILAGASGVHNVSRFLQSCQETITPLSHPVIIPNSVDGTHFHVSGRERRGPFRFIHVSSFHTHKDVQTLIAGFALLGLQRTDWELVLVGPSGKDIRAFAAQAFPDGRIRWAGELPYRLVGAELRQADALVLFSRFENQPCVISEALCCGLPVVSSAVGGIPEELTPDKGILVPVGDGAALARALDTMMREYDRFDRDRIAASAADRHGYDSVGRRFMDYYASVVSR